MSWSKEGLYKNVETAHHAIEHDARLPREIKDYIIRGLSHWSGKSLDHDSPVYIKGFGHVCDGPGSYEQTTCTLEVNPIPFVEK